MEKFRVRSRKYQILIVVLVLVLLYNIYVFARLRRRVGALGDIKRKVASKVYAHLEDEGALDTPKPSSVPLEKPTVAIREIARTSPAPSTQTTTPKATRLIEKQLEFTPEKKAAEIQESDVDRPLSTQLSHFAEVVKPATASALLVNEVPTEFHWLKNAAVVVLCYDRPDYLTKTLEHLMRARLAKHIKKYISQDGDEYQTQAVAMSFDQAEYMMHPRTLPETLTLNTTDPVLRLKTTPSTMFLAAHYKWALDKLFLEKRHSHVIVVEDDMVVTKDFFQFFEMLAPLLDIDPTIWCISSWNDQAFQHLDLPAARLFRTSHFPGLGWMLKRELWLELTDKFPEDNWDHWMRTSTTSKNRHCVAPFLSRNYNIGAGGATSNKQFYQQFLKTMQHHRGPPTPFGDLAYLLLDRYTDAVKKLIRGGRVLKPVESITFYHKTEYDRGSTYVVPYIREQYEQLATQLSIHPAPRAHFNYTTWLRFGGANIFLVDRRLSPFIPSDFALRPHPSLRIVRAGAPGIACSEACELLSTSTGSETWSCGTDQFDFINDCDQLAAAFDGCPYGCTQGWGDDIPNMEAWSIGHKPMCLVSEVVPTCSGAYPHTVRLCPCISKNHAAKRKTQLKISPAVKQNQDCDDVCEALHQDNGENGYSWKCDPDQFRYLNSCEVLKKAFPCEKCDYNYGKDLPNFVSYERDANYKKCLIMKTSSDITCGGSHPNTKRLCPCVPLGTR